MSDELESQPISVRAELVEARTERIGRARPSTGSGRTGPDWIALLLLLLGGALLFTHLDNGRLWQDEAETAVLGRNVLRYGYPRAYDGINWINPALPLRAGYAWTYHSWLPMYAAAGSFALFGADTWPARFPLAVMGLLSIWLF